MKGFEKIEKLDFVVTHMILRAYGDSGKCRVCIQSCLNAVTTSAMFPGVPRQCGSGTMKSGIIRV